MTESSSDAGEQIQIKLEPGEVTVEGGDGGEIVASIRNAGRTIDQFGVEVAGIDPAWVSLDTESVALFPGESGLVRIRVRPPASRPGTGARHVFQFRVWSAFNPAVSNSVAAVVRLVGSSEPAQPVDLTASPVASTPPVDLSVVPATAAHLARAGRTTARTEPLPDLHAQNIALQLHGETAAGATSGPAPALLPGSDGLSTGLDLTPTGTSPFRPLHSSASGDGAAGVVPGAAEDGPAAYASSPARDAPHLLLDQLPAAAPGGSESRLAAAPDATAAGLSEDAPPPPLIAVAEQPAAYGSDGWATTAAPYLPPAANGGSATLTAPETGFSFRAQRPTTPLSRPGSGGHLPSEASPPAAADGTSPGPTTGPAAPVQLLPQVAVPAAVSPPPGSVVAEPEGLARSSGSAVPAGDGAADLLPPLRTPALFSTEQAPSGAPPVQPPSPPGPQSPAASRLLPQTDSLMGQIGLRAQPPPPARSPVEVTLVPDRPAAIKGGAPLEVAVQVRNLGSANDQYTIEVIGLDPAWYSMESDSMSVFPGDTQVIPIVLQAPIGAAVKDHPFQVRARSYFDDDVSGSAAGVLRVERVPTGVLPSIAPSPTLVTVPAAAPPTPSAAARLEVALLPAEVTVVPGGAPVPVSVRISNPGSTIEDFGVEVARLDPSWYSLSAPSVAVFPGASATLRVTFAPLPERSLRDGEYQYVVQVRSRRNPSLAAEASGLVRIDHSAGAPSPGSAERRGETAGSSGLLAPAVAAQAAAGTAILAAGSPDLLSVTLNPAEVKLVAGVTPAVIMATIHNLADERAGFDVAVEELDPAWYALAAPSVSVAPGATAPLAIKLNLPATGVRPGPYAFAVRATSQLNPLTSDVARGVMQVTLPIVFSAELLPKRMAGPLGHCRLRLANSGPGDLQFDLSGQDAESRLAYRFRPRAPVVAAGSRAEVQLRVGTRWPRLVGADQAYPFTVTARPVEGEDADARQVSGEFAQRPRFRSWLPPLIFLLAALLPLWLISPWRPDLGQFPLIGGLLPPAAETPALTATAPAPTAVRADLAPTVPAEAASPTMAAAAPTPTALPTVAPTLPPAPVFSGAFKAVHDAFPDVIGEPVADAWSDPAGNLHQSTTRGQLTAIKGSNDVYFSGPGPAEQGSWHHYRVLGSNVTEIP